MSANNIPLKWQKTLNYDLDGEYKDKLVFTNDYPVPVLQELDLLDKNTKLKMMEVGCQEGRTSFHLLEKYLLHPESKMYCLDLFEDGIPLERNFDHNVGVLGYKDKIVKMRGPSWKTLRKLNNETDFESFDFIYIDGWHGANGVIEDAVQCWKLLKVGGILSFDDYYWCSHFKPQRTPKIAIDSFAYIFGPFLKKIDSSKVSFKKIISNDNEAQHLIDYYQ